MPRVPAARDRALALLLSAAAAAFYAAAFQRRWYMDGPFLAEQFRAGAWHYVHLLYLPFVHLLHGVRSLLGGTDPDATMRLASILPGGAAVGLLFLAGRRLGASTPLAVGFASAIGLSPTAVFFSTVIENHALHAACASGAFLAACVYGGSPSFRRALLLGISAVLAIASHTTGVLLLPGLVFLALLLAARSPGRPARGQLVAFVSPFLAFTGFVAALAWKKGGSPFRFEAALGPGGRVLRERLAEVDLSRSLGYLAEEAAFFPFLLAAVAPFGFGRALRVDRPLALLVLAFSIPTLLVMPLWGYPDYGSHFLPIYPALLLPFLASRSPADAESAGGRVPLLGLVLGLAGFANAFHKQVPIWLVPSFAAAAAGGWASSRFLPPGLLGGLLVAAVPLGQGARSVAVLAERNRDDPERRWIEGVRAATRDEGVLLTAGYGEPILLRLASKLEVIEFGLLLQAPDAAGMRREILARAEEVVASGRPLWLDSRVEETYGASPVARAHLEALRDRLASTPVESGAFRGWRLARRR